MSYPRYPWIGNRISEEDMGKLYRLKQQTKKPITILVAEAISQYLSIHKDNEGQPQNFLSEVSYDLGAENHREP
jgi:hypothetical protein